MKLHPSLGLNPGRNPGHYNLSPQVLVAKLLHSLHHDDPATHHALLAAAKEELLAGGPRRTRHTLPALGFCALQIVRRAAAAGSDSPVTAEALLQARNLDDSEKLHCTKMPSLSAAPDCTMNSNPSSLCHCQWVLEICGLLADGSRQPTMALRLMLAAGFSASEEAHLELLAYQFFEEVRTTLQIGLFSYKNCVSFLRPSFLSLEVIYPAFLFPGLHPVRGGRVRPTPPDHGSALDHRHTLPVPRVWLREPRCAGAECVGLRVTAAQAGGPMPSRLCMLTPLLAGLSGPSECPPCLACSPNLLPSTLAQKTLIMLSNAMYACMLPTRMNRQSPSRAPS